LPTLFRALLLAFCSGACGLAAAAAAPSLALPPGAKAVWALPQGAALPAGARFEVDAAGSVWLLPMPRLLTRADGAALVLDEMARDLVFDGRELLLATDLAAGGLKLRQLKGGLAAKVQRKLMLPGPGWRLAAGSDGAVAFGFDADQGRSLLFRVQDRHKVLAWPERVLAAVGTAEGWFLATPSGIQRVSKAGALQAWGVLPGGASSLAWVQGAGLAAAGPKGAGLFTAAGKLQPLLDAQSPRVRARGSDLYVLLPEAGGVLKITGLGAR
jgi:hypothetical protein